MLPDKDYICYDMTQKRIYISSHVIFLCVEFLYPILSLSCYVPKFSHPQSVISHSPPFISVVNQNHIVSLPTLSSISIMPNIVPSNSNHQAGVISPLLQPLLRHHRSPYHLHPLWLKRFKLSFNMKVYKLFF